MYDAMAEKNEEKKNDDSEKADEKQIENKETSDDVAKINTGEDQHNTEQKGDEEKKSDINGSGDEAEKESGDEEEEEVEGDLYTLLCLQRLPHRCNNIFKHVNDVSDGAEEGGDDAEMEADAEEQGEAAEKVHDHLTNMHQNDCEHVTFKTKVGWCLSGQ